MDRCPICEVAVKPENLLRHLNDIHPRHPDTAHLVKELREQPGRIAARNAPRPLRLSRLHVAIVVVVVVVAIAGYALAPYLSSGEGQSFPCVSGTGRAYHWHTNLQIDSDTGSVTIPASIGIRTGFLSCMQILHTHAADGRIHIEPDTPEQARLYSVGDFFRVWGKSFGSPTQMHVNGTAVTPSASVILHNEATIHLQYSFFA